MASEYLKPSLSKEKREANRDKELAELKDMATNPLKYHPINVQGKAARGSEGKAHYTTFNEERVRLVKAMLEDGFGSGHISSIFRRCGILFMPETANRLRDNNTWRHVVLGKGAATGEITTERVYYVKALQVNAISSEDTRKLLHRANIMMSLQTIEDIREGRLHADVKLPNLRKPRNGTLKKTNPMIPEPIVIAIKELLKKHYTSSQIRAVIKEQFGKDITKSNVDNIASGKSYRHIGEKVKLSEVGCKTTPQVPEMEVAYLERKYNDMDGYYGRTQTSEED
jgi:hypothetical protein